LGCLHRHGPDCYTSSFVRREALISLLFLVPAQALAQQTDPFFQPEKPPDPSHSQGKPRPAVSTSGTDLTPPQHFVPIHVGGSDPTLAHRIRALEAKVADLEKQREPAIDSLAWWSRRIRLSAFVQPQFLASVQNAAASLNADANGVLPPGISAN